MKGLYIPHKYKFKTKQGKWRFIFLLTFIYFLAGKLGLSLAIVNPSSSPFWPPTGISLASFILWDFEIWPAIFIGAFLVNITTAGTILTSILIAAGNMLEGMCGAYLVRLFVHEKEVFTKPLNIFIYVGLAGVLSTMISATFGVTVLEIGGFVKLHNYIPVWITWWLGDMGGAVIVAPVILLWKTEDRIIWRPFKIFELVAALLVLLIIAQFGFIGGMPKVFNLYPLSFLSLPVLIWLALRFSPRETSGAVLLLSLIAVFATTKNFGPFVSGNPNQSLINVQVFMGIVFLTVMPLSAVVLQMKKLRETLVKKEESHRVLAAIVESSNDAIIGKSNDYKIISWNRGAEELYGYSAEEVLGKEVSIIIPEDRKNETELIKKDLTLGLKISQLETERKRKDGTKLIISLTMSPIRDSKGVIIGSSAIERDITEHVNARTQIQNSLKEKELLLKEIHHRVKNNLQIISSLLSLQSNFVTDEKCLAILKENRNRIKSMALVHEKLYESKNLSRVSLSSYIQDVVSELVNAFALKNSDINISLDVKNIEMDIEEVITFGLILNELITNSLKHAFKNAAGNDKSIEIKFFEEKPEWKVLIIKDNGNGLPKGFNLRKQNSLGLNLVLSLVEQMNGEIKYNSDFGTEFMITFPASNKQP